MVNFRFLFMSLSTCKLQTFGNLVNSSTESEWFGIGKVIYLEILI